MIKTSAALGTKFELYPGVTDHGGTVNILSVVKET